MASRQAKARKPRRRDVFDLEDVERRDVDWDEWHQLRRRLLVDASKKPDTSLPIGLGIAALVAALMFGLGPLIPLVAIVLLVAGVAAFARRMFLGLRRLTTNVFRRLFESRKQRQERMLEDLDRRLRNDGEPRTEHLLQKLSHLYQTLQEDIQDGTLTVTATDVLESVDQINEVCIDHLDESHRLWEEACADAFVAKARLKQREDLIQDVADSVAYLEVVVGQLRERSLNRNRKELKRLRKELDEALRVAQRVEERTDELVESSDIYQMPESS